MTTFDWIRIGLEIAGIVLVPLGGSQYLKVLTLVGHFTDVVETIDKEHPEIGKTIKQDVVSMAKGSKSYSSLDAILKGKAYPKREKR